MICFQVQVNGETVCTAGGDDLAVTSANVYNFVDDKDGSSYFTLVVRGQTADSSDGSARESMNWVRQDLSVDDKVTIAIVNLPTCDPPAQRSERKSKEKNSFGPLPIPTSVANIIKARELLRVWAAGGKQHVALATGVWEDPANWGIFLVDLAKHIANAYHETTGQSTSAVLQRLREGFDAEWSQPTDRPTGKIGG